MVPSALALSQSLQTSPPHQQHHDGAPTQQADAGTANHGEDDGTLVSLIKEMETQYVQECSLDDTPRGFYGAFFQPCEFRFRASKENYSADDEETEADSEDTANPVDACSDEASTTVSSPAASHWFLNLTDRLDKDDWTIDDIPDTMEDLLVWPDECVGVMPRCYKLDDMSLEMQDALSLVFSNGFPPEATHVRVDCRGDAAQLVRVAYTFAESMQLDETATSLIFWVVTVVLLIIVLGMWSVYACLRKCLGSRGSFKYPGCGRSRLADADEGIAAKDGKTVAEDEALSRSLLHN